MGTLVGKLKALNVARVKQPGMYGDGGGLWLQVTSSGARSWIFRYWVEERDPATGEVVRDEMGKVRGRSREMGLGSFHVVSLEQARELASENRKLRQQGVDPIEASRVAKLQAAIDAAKAKTFDECRDEYIKAHSSGWRNAKHRQQWQNTLNAYCSPVFGSMPVQVIDTDLVLKAIEPIWATKPEMASRVRGRIEQILDWAKVKKYREGENPARWRGHLNKLLPARSKVRKVVHHTALHYTEASALMAEIHKREGIAARALEFAILTAARSGEVLGARWEEFDLNAAVWTVPAARMKAGKEHRVPMALPALKIIKDMEGSRGSELVFPGGNPGRPLSEKALWKVLHRMKIESTTVHGLRSTFRDWAADRTSYPNHVVEMALAHTIGDKVEAAYRRGDLFDKRQRLMDEWARFCNTPASAGDVIQLRRGA